MPGPVSDSYDPEWGTAHNAYMIREALSGVHDSVTGILGNREPLYIIDLVSKVCSHGRLNTTGGYGWSYLEKK